MATSTKVKKAGQSKSLEGPDLAAYARLRVMLDGFQGMAIHYFSGAGDSKERKKRATEIEKRIRAFQDMVRKHGGATKADSSPCPKGWCDCDGVCIPPPCGICP
jgi:hypothetical protein